MTSEQQKNEETELERKHSNMLDAIHLCPSDKKHGSVMCPGCLPILQLLESKDTAHEKSLDIERQRYDSMLKEQHDIQSGLAKDIQHYTKVAEDVEALEKSLQLLTQERDMEIKRARDAEEALKKAVEALKLVAEATKVLAKPYEHMSIKEEFDKAFKDNFSGLRGATRTPEKSALFGAKWMAERCAQLLEHNGLRADGIRQLKIDKESNK